MNTQKTTGKIPKADDEKTYLDHVRDLDEHIRENGAKLTEKEKQEVFKTIFEVSN